MWVQANLQPCARWQAAAWLALPTTANALASKTSESISLGLPGGAFPWSLRDNLRLAWSDPWKASESCLSDVYMSTRHLFWQETNFLFLPPLGNVPVPGICPHLSCFACWDKEVISFLKPSFPLKKKVLEFSFNSRVDSSVFLYTMYLKLFLFPCIIFLLRFFS